MDFRAELVKILRKELKEDVSAILEVPPALKLGDFALPCFFIAKKLKKDPTTVAKELSKKISAKIIDHIEAKGPYLNFFFKREVIAEEVLKEIFSAKEDYGKDKKNKTVVFEYPSPNTNKPLHLGHIRNMLLGQSFAMMFAHLGNSVVQVNLNNDRGIHICKSMIAYKKWGDNKEPDKKSDHFVGDFYVLYGKNMTPDLEKETQDMLQLWEQHDPEVRALWKKMNEWALQGFAETYKKFEAVFDKTYYESEIYDKGKSIILDGIQRKIFSKEPDGSVVADLTPYGLGKKVVLRADGTSIYVTQDIYVAKLKFDDFHPDLSVTITGSEQNHHFNVLFKILELLGFEFASKCHHFSYGMVNLPEGKMKSREGTVVDADDLIEQMEKLAEEEVRKRYSKLDEKEIRRRAHIIGMGALRFFILKMDPFKDMVFNPKESISFEGETGPYVQYTYARIKSILRKYGKPVRFKDIDFSLFKLPEIEIIKLLESFPRVVQEATKEYKPSSIAHYLIELAQKFNSYYDSYQILKEKDPIKHARLGLILAIAQVLKLGLSLLHIDVLEEM